MISRASVMMSIVIRLKWDQYDDDTDVDNYNEQEHDDIDDDDDGNHGDNDNEADDDDDNEDNDDKSHEDPLRIRTPIWRKPIFCQPCLASPFNGNRL